MNDTTDVHYADILVSCCFACSDGETFISADDLRINLWNLEINSQSFNIVDVKPANMEDLTGKLASPSKNYSVNLYVKCSVLSNWWTSYPIA